MTWKSMTWDMARARSRQLPRKYKVVAPIGDDALNMRAYVTSAGNSIPFRRDMYGDKTFNCCGFAMCCCDGVGKRVFKYACGCMDMSIAEMERHTSKTDVDIHDGFRRWFRVGALFLSRCPFHA